MQQHGKVLYEKDMHSRKYPASTTKILTAIIALEKCDLNEIATASHSAVFSVKSGYSIANIQEGESFTIGELLDVLMLQSANEAANVIAEHISGSVGEFAKLMNQKAKEIGCLDSNFVNANGAHNDNHYSTAYDLALIARYCMQNEEFRKIVIKRECSLPTTEIYTEPRIFRNTNSLMQENSRYYYPYCNGIKTGFTTPAKNCLISSSNKNNFELISVILHAEATEDGLSARYLDTINLFEYGYNNYNQDDILVEYNMLSASEQQIQEENLKEEILFTIEDDFKKDQEAVAGIVENEHKVKMNPEIKEWMKIIVGVLILLVMWKRYKIKLRLREEEREANLNYRVSHREIVPDSAYNFKLT